jgi:hypothetical protein
MTYQDLNEKASERISSVPIFWAFNKSQFEEGCKKLGVQVPEEELNSTGAGGFIKKTDVSLWNDALEANEKAREEFLNDMNNLEDAFTYELGNHEYIITYNDAEAWQAVGLSLVESTKEQREAFCVARTNYLASASY